VMVIFSVGLSQEAMNRTVRIIVQIISIFR
jgi:hypothetical protein